MFALWHYLVVCFKFIGSYLAIIFLIKQFRKFHFHATRFETEDAPHPQAPAIWWDRITLIIPKEVLVQDCGNITIKWNKSNTAGIKYKWNIKYEGLRITLKERMPNKAIMRPVSWVFKVKCVILPYSSFKLLDSTLFPLASWCARYLYLVTKQDCLPTRLVPSRPALLLQSPAVVISADCGLYIFW